MATESLVRIIHDLRGPLNTLAILGEVLRSSRDAAAPQHLEAIQTTTRTIANLGAMLERVRACVDTMATELTPIDLFQVIESALGATTTPGVSVTFSRSLAQVPTVFSCPERLMSTLQDALTCCKTTLPHGGNLTIQATPAAGETRITVVPDGPAVQLPAAHNFHKLSPARPGQADWFLLSCRVEGLGGTIAISDDPSIPAVTICLPNRP